MNRSAVALAAALTVLGPLLPGPARADGSVRLPIAPALAGPLAPLDPDAIQVVPQVDGTYSASYQTDVGPGGVPPLPQLGLDPIGGRVSTFAGGSADGGTPTGSTLFQPYAVAVAPDGSLVVADTYNNRVRRIAGNVVTTIAGTGDAGFAGDGGPATAAALNFPTMVAVDPTGAVFVADTWNDRVRRIDPLSGVITTVVGIGPNEGTSAACGQGDGGAAALAPVFAPAGVAVLPDGDLLVADMRCNTLRRMDAQTGVLTTVAGRGEAYGTYDGDGGPATTHALPAPIGVAVDASGNAIVADSSRRIRYVNFSTSPVTLFAGSTTPLQVAPGEIRTIAGTGQQPGPTEPASQPSRSAPIATPRALSVAADGDVLFAEDAYLGDSDADPKNTMRVRRIDSSTGDITTIAGNRTVGVGADGVAATSTPLAYPAAAVADAAGNILVVDRGNNRLRRVVSSTGLVEAAAGQLLGDGLPATRATLSHPFGVASSSHGVYVMDSANRRLRRIDPSGTITTVLGGGGRPCLMQGAARVRCTDGSSGDGGPGTAARLSANTWAVDASDDGLVAVVDGDRVRLLNDTDTAVTLRTGVTLAAHAVTTIAGGGTGTVPWGGAADATAVRLSQPRGVAITPWQSVLVTEMSTGTDRIDRVDQIDLWTGQIYVRAGSPYTTAQAGVGTYRDGDIYSARFFQPYGLAVTSYGDIYVADAGNNMIRDIGEVNVTTVAGNGTLGFAGDGGLAGEAALAEPSDVDIAPDGSLLIVDAANLRIRRVDPTGIIRTVAGSGESLVNRTCTSARPCAHFGGDGGPALAAQLNVPTSATLLSTSVLLVADRDNNRIRAVPLSLTGFPPPGCFRAEQVDGGYGHSLALRDDGTVWAWGANTFGQLGDGTGTDRLDPVQVVGLTNIVAIAAGDYHSLALRSDGTVWAWGDNFYGQLGDGTPTGRIAPVQVVGLTGITAISAGVTHSLAVRSDGSVWAWGWYSTANDAPPYPDGPTRPTAVKVTGITNAVKVAAGYQHSQVLRSDGTVWAWGANDSGQLGDGTTSAGRWAPAAVSGLTGVTSISTFESHIVATRNDGSVWAWGRNDHGQLGDGTTTDQHLPVHVFYAAGQAVAAVAGYDSNVYLRADGTVWAWGSGDEPWVDRRVPALDAISAMGAGSGHALAVRGDGTVWAWGRNDQGQLGDGTTTDRTGRVGVGACE